MSANLSEFTKTHPAVPGIFWATVSVVCWGTLFPAVSFLVTRGNVDCYSMRSCAF